jgi:hypothetical protein
VSTLHLLACDEPRADSHSSPQSPHLAFKRIRPLYLHCPI